MIPGMDHESLKKLIDIGAELVFKELTKEPTAKRQQHKCTLTVLLEGDEVELKTPADDGKGAWTLASWRPEPSGHIWAHWTRVFVEPAPRFISDLRVEGDGSGASPWGPKGPTEEEASSSQP